MAANGMNIYQFKVTLKDIRPPIWRRIQVSRNITFFELHHTIQEFLGLIGGHMHQFEVKDPKTGIEECISKPYDPEKPLKIDQYFVAVKDKGQYEWASDYDTGEDWKHDLVLEKIVHAEENVKYPRCVKSKGTHPLEGVQYWESDSETEESDDPNCDSDSDSDSEMEYFNELEDINEMEDFNETQSEYDSDFDFETAEYDDVFMDVF